MRPVAVQGVVAVAAKMDDERVATLKAENGPICQCGQSPLGPL